MTIQKTTLSFNKAGLASFEAVVLVFDLEGYSTFVGKQDTQKYVPKYLNRVFEAVGTCIYGGPSYWMPKPDDSKTLSAMSILPIHEKFLGDGALYIFSLDDVNADVHRFTTMLCNRIWNVKAYFNKILEKSIDDVPVVEIPKRIRFGITRGPVHKLDRVNGGDPEYVGYSINLAARFQSYCPEIGFIASARLEIPEETLVKHRYKRVVANNIRGFDREVVFVDKDEYEDLEEKVRDKLFEELIIA